MRRIVILGAFLFCFFQGLSQDLVWRELITISDFCHAYPERMDSFLVQIDWSTEGLEEARVAFESGDHILTCKLLLDYYGEKAQKASMLVKSGSYTSTKKEEVFAILKDTYTFYLQTAKVPRLADGHLDWSFEGPTKDIEWAWALNRHRFIRQMLDIYSDTNDPVIVSQIDLIIKDWITSSIPYPKRKSNTAMWRGLEVSFRASAWAEVFSELFNAKELSAATKLLLLTSIPEHAHYLRNYHSHGNWLTMELSSLAKIATSWPEFKNAREWLGYTIRVMTENLEEQVYPDGAQTELTTSYHHTALVHFSKLLDIANQARFELPSIYRQRIESMWNYLAYSLRPNGTNPLNNDSDLRDYRKPVLEAAKIFQRQDWQYLVTNGLEGTKPKTASIIFPWAGQAISRNGFSQQSHWSFFDAGPWGTGHQHNDKLHLSVSAFGRDFLVDGGRFSYRGKTAEKFRDYAVSSASHNVILIDGIGQAAGPPRVGEPLDTSDYHIGPELTFCRGAVMDFEGLQGKAKHVRSVVYLKDQFWIVIDQVMTDRPREIETLWHWHPACDILVENDLTVTTGHDMGNLTIIPLDSDDWELELVEGQEYPEPQGWYSSEYNKYEPNTTSIYSRKINGNSIFGWLIFPSKSEIGKVRAEIVDYRADGLKINVKSEVGNREVFVPYGSASKIKVK